MTKRFQNGIMYISIIFLMTLILALVKISADREQQWLTAESKTYQQTNDIDIYVVSNKKDIETVIQGDYHFSEHDHVYMNLKANIYKTGFHSLASGLLS